MVTVGMRRPISISKKVRLEDSPLKECTDSQRSVKTGRAFLLSSAPNDRRRQRSSEKHKAIECSYRSLCWL